MQAELAPPSRPSLCAWACAAFSAAPPRAHPAPPKSQTPIARRLLPSARAWPLVRGTKPELVLIACPPRPQTPGRPPARPFPLGGRSDRQHCHLSSPRRWPRTCPASAPGGPRAGMGKRRSRHGHIAPGGANASGARTEGSKVIRSPTTRREQLPPRRGLPVPFRSLHFPAGHGRDPTGMGSDGTLGLKLLKRHGFFVIPRMKRAAWSTACPNPQWIGPGG